MPIEWILHCAIMILLNRVRSNFIYSECAISIKWLSSCLCRPSSPCSLVFLPRLLWLLALWISVGETCSPPSNDPIPTTSLYLNTFCILLPTLSFLEINLWSNLSPLVGTLLTPTSSCSPSKIWSSCGIVNWFYIISSIIGNTLKKVAKYATSKHTKSHSIFPLCTLNGISCDRHSGSIPFEEQCCIGSMLALLTTILYQGSFSIAMSMSRHSCGLRIHWRFPLCGGMIRCC